MAAPKLNALNDVAAAVVADSPELRTRLYAVIDQMLGEVEYVMRLGTHAEKAAYLRVVLPSLLRSMQGAEGNEADRAKKAAYERLQAAMRGDDSTG